MATAASSGQNNEWADAQKKFWENWTENQKNFFGQSSKASPFAGNWEQFFGTWQETMTGNGKPGADMYKNLFTQAGQGFLTMMEKFYQSAGAAKQPEEAAKDWLASLQAFYDSAIAANSAPIDLTAQYKSFMETMAPAAPVWWSNIFKANAQGEHPHHSTAFLFDPFGFYASVPGIGYSREKQDHVNLLYKLWVEYEGEMRKYNSEMTRVGLKALKAFQEYLQNPPKDAKPLQSLKDIYVKWVDVNEEVFADYALSDEYTKMYGEVVNALMAYKKQMHILTDDVMEQMNLPTRSELDSLHQKTQILKRENAQLKKDVAALKAASGKTPKAAQKPVSKKKGKKK